MIEALLNAWTATSNLEIVSVVFGLLYVVLAARENPWCWPAAFIGTGTAILLFWDASLLMESALNVYYLLMALYGWWRWQHGGTQQSELRIQRFGIKQHAICAVIVMTLTVASGSLLASNTSAALPYLDSFTTWAAIITTWMIANKILENWLYWIVIDSLSVFLYLERGLVLYAALFVAYTFIAAFGYFKWRASYADKH